MTMKLSLLLVFFVTGCSLWEPRQRSREISSTVDEIHELTLSDDTIFANGVNFIQLRIKPLGSQASEIKVENDQEAEIGTIQLVDGLFQVSVKPKLRSPNITLGVSWPDGHQAWITLYTTLSPIKHRLTPLRPSASVSTYRGGLNYTRQENFSEGLYEGFSISNDGGTPMTPGESQRSFDFSFEEQARQNLSFMVNDYPSEYVSHSMHSHFMLFPRSYLPTAQVSADKITVTLPTGELLVFSKTGEIIDGVFDEGPVDVSADRFKRHYADLKYRGGGILLRANARGQMPQQGQFESTKIDMEFGVKFSADVLIINGTTGQRCRRPKTDFWPSGDVSPILFNFPTDEEFEAYLKLHCKFGMPVLGGGLK
jgi:hypothetical protein